MNEVIKNQLEELKLKAKYHDEIAWQNECERDKCVNEAIKSIRDNCNENEIYFDDNFTVRDIYDTEIILDKIIYDSYVSLVGSDGMNKEMDYDIAMFPIDELIRIISALEQKVFK